MLGALLPLLVTLICGCRVVQTTADLPGKTVRAVSGKPASTGFDPVLLQQRLMRFTDDFAGSMLVAIDALREGTNAPNPIELQRLRLNCVGGCFVVVSGPNEMMNLVDLYRLVSLTRALVEEQWLPGPYGESARPMLEACQRAETNITQIAASVLNPEQLEELRASVAHFKQEHPDIRGALFTRGLGVNAETSTARQTTGDSGGGILNLLMIDPLAGLDPAARELAETRLFAERALYVAQRTPMLLRWQSELLVLETAEMPAIRDVRTNADRISATLERTGAVAEQIPSLLRSEREQWTKTIVAQETQLTNLAAQVKVTLDAGTKMSDSVNTTLTTMQRLHESLESGGAKQSNSPAAETEPFRILDYAETAQRIESAADRLTGLLLTLDQTLGSTNLASLAIQVTPAVQQAQAGGRDLVDYAFRKAVLLVGISCALVLGSALVFRWSRPRRP